MDICSKSLTAVLATLLTATAPHTALANSAPFIAPFTDPTISVGETLQFRVIPTDRDHTVPALHLDNPPAGSRFDDNLDGTRTFVWTPADDARGVHYYHFTALDAEDPSLSHTRTLKVRVLGEDGSTGNQAPVLTALPDRQTTLGTGFDFRVEALDADHTVPSLTVAPLPDGAVFKDNLDGSRQFIWTPTALSPGTVWLSFTATDADEASLSDTQTLRLQLIDAGGTLLPGTLGNSEPDGAQDNRAPIILPLPPQSIALGQSFDFTVRALDVDGTQPVLSITALPDGASFADNGDGSYQFRWTPQAANLGDTDLLIAAVDAMDPAVRVTLAFTLEVYRDSANPINFPPVFEAFPDPLIRAGDTLTQRVVALDPDLSVPALRVLDGPDDAEFIDNLDGSRTLRWTSSDEDIGDTPISFIATDAEHADVQVSHTMNVRVVAADSLARPGERLRTLARAQGFDVGFSAPRQFADLPDHELFQQLAAEEFSLVSTQDTFMMMNSIHPQRDVFHFDELDALAEYAAAAQLRLHAQALLSHEQLPAWLLSLAPDAVETALYEHIDSVAGRYRSRIAFWDVVSDALDDQGRLRESIWTRGMAADYIARAFARTRAVDPTAQLIYSDHDVITENPKSDAMYALLKRELAAGTPIDGVGFKGPLYSSFSDYASIESNLQRFADLGLAIHITEFEVPLNAGDTLEQQAQVYSRVLEICLQQPACMAIQAEGYTDRYSQQAQMQPRLFTDQYQPKPAYEAWQSTLQNFGE